MKLINLTPHAISWRDENGIDTVYPASGHVARVSTAETPAGKIAGMPVVKRSFGAVDFGVASIEANAIYIVSAMVLDALKEHPLRGQFLAPNTGASAIRDDSGRIAAVTSFVTA